MAPSLFREAVRGGNRGICELLLEKAKDTKLLGTVMGDTTKRTPLHIAASCGHEDLVDFFLAEGANFQFEDEVQ